ncbi:hypothetical protein NEF87_004404 [Candidatus Lokiarchaeum ossiferum]|uniref:DNA helicase n=1 Tax=Candidatus Lokiarchaeum ossiferum TaxID=2951803 RepID=A0ABY6I085_9ARCH|nr:hypothetical protein NEF87_004404 [Candidatus Lokiarchaeum sp. B-35]
MVIETDAPPSNPVGDFEDFLKNFEETPNEFKYRQKISEAYARSEHHITVLFEDILNYDPPLANYLKTNPEQALQEAVESFKNIIRIDAGGYFNPDEDFFVQIATHNNSNEVPLRMIRAKHIDRLIFLKGIIIRSSVVRPKITNATFECPICGNIMQEEQPTSKLTPPRECTNPACKNTKEFKVDTRQSEFINHQSITIQEAPEDLRSGDIPQTLQAVLHNHLVDSARPGERVKIMGVLQSIPKEDRRGRLTTVFMTQLMVNHIEGIKETDEEQDLTQEDIDEIHALSLEPMIQNKIARSIARGILGHDQLKMAAALSLFSGNQKLKKDGSKLRGDIHVLFMGDPGTGKSQILQNCAKIAQRSVYTSGKGSSAAGLTAAVVKESDNTGMQLEAGALVLASGGIACTTEDTKFIREDGKRISFKELFHSFGDEEGEIFPDFKVFGLNQENLKIEPFKIKRAFKIRNQKKIYKLTTATGRSLNLTEDNEIFTSNNSKFLWTETHNIKTGDYIAVPKLISFNHSDHFQPDFAYICGLIASDGHIALSDTKGRGEFYNSNTDMVEIFKSTLDRLNISHNTYVRKPQQRESNKQYKSTKNNYQIYNSTKKFAQDLIEFGVPKGNKSTKFALSKKIFTYSKQTISLFLRGVFDGDGCLRSNPNSVIFSTGMHENAVLFQNLLLRFGIISTVVKKSTDWHCEITGTLDCIAFYNQIGTLHPVKKAKFKKLKINQIKDRIDILPNFQEYFERLKLKNKGKLGSDIYRYVWNYCKPQVAPSKYHLKRINQVVKEKFLHNFIESDILWDKIIDIEEIRSEYVYDFTMEGTNNFVGNNIIMHNCIDEFDKMRKQDRSAIHEAMEQQTISIAKAGIVATLQAQTAIIAAANPKQGRWNDFETPAANINLSPPILSRFDLIFIVRDVPEKNSDDRIAQYILRNHMEGHDETFVDEEEKKKNIPTEDDFIPMDLLKKYIQYCKNNCHPKLTRESARKIQDYYVKMRTSNPDNPTAVSIVARTLDGMVRMSEAYAKMALRDVVLLEDTEAMISLLDRSLHEIGYDKETGKVDMDVMLTGTSSNKRNKLNLILEKIRELQLEDPSEDLTWEDIYEPLATVEGVTEQFIKSALEEWHKDGTLYCPKNDHYRLSTKPKQGKF